MISVIIPALNEAMALPVLLEQLAGETEAHEIILADGGSTDATRDIARMAGAQIVETERGRGRQLVAGAAAASGDVLLFLHADSGFPKGGLGALHAVLAASPGAVGGNFGVRYDGQDGFSRWMEKFYAFLNRHRIYYGDSGIFVRREVYDRLGGIYPYAAMEDYDFMLRLEQSGPTVHLAGHALLASSRRFEGRGRMTFGLWVAMHLGFHLGLSPDWLGKLYRHFGKIARSRLDRA